MIKDFVMEGAILLQMRISTQFNNELEMKISNNSKGNGGGALFFGLFLDLCMSFPIGE